MNIQRLQQQIGELKERVVSTVETYWGFVPPTLKDTIKINTYTLFKIPLIAFLSPRVIFSSDEKIVVKIGLNYRSSNHLHSMYFGALAIGADLSVGTLASRFIDQSQKNVQLIFKDFKAEYLKRAEGDVHFTCEQGQEIKDLVRQAVDTGERVQQSFQVTATVPARLGDQPVSQFYLTLSLKLEPVELK